MSAADFGFVTGPQPASAVYCQPMQQPTADGDDVFQLQRPPGQDAAYHKCSPTTVLDLGSGTIHKSPGQCSGDNGDVGWQHYQPVDYHHPAAVHHHHDHQQQQQCFQMQQSCDGVGYHHHPGQQLQYATIKTEDGPESLDLMYPMAVQDVDYYAQLSSSSSSADVACHKGNAAVGMMHNDGSMDFIGADGTMPADVSASQPVVDYMVLDPAKLLLTNNNFYSMDAYCGNGSGGTETNNNDDDDDHSAGAAAFNDFQLNAADIHSWSQAINQ